MPESNTESALFQIGALLRLQDSIRLAAAPATLCVLAKEVRAAVTQLHASDAGAAWVTQTFSRLNDAIVERAIQLVLPAFRLPFARWCWLGLGSEGRLEQTLVTDQDNALVFSASDDSEADALKTLFLPFAMAVNELLAQCGFPLCDGQIMASNPTWCLSLEQWKTNFATWVRTPEPEALLNAAIFFDFRPLVSNPVESAKRGVSHDFGLAAELRRYLTELARGNQIFARMLTHNALAAKPPLGRLRDFVSEGSDSSIDLKKFGSRIFVDTARILALWSGVSATSTVERFRGAVQQGVISGSDALAAIAAFHTLQHFRLVAQLDSMPDGGGDSRIQPGKLGDFQRQLLMNALRQEKSVQQILQARFNEVKY